MKRLKERKKMTVMKISAGIFASLVVAFWMLILYVEMGYGPLNPAFFFTLIPLIPILALLVFFVRRQDKAVKAGVPLRDERSEKIENRAGRYAMIGTVWFLLAMAFYQMFMEELALPDIPLRYFIWIVFFVILGLFAGFKLYFGRKGE
jgi:MFS family permease